MTRSFNWGSYYLFIMDTKKKRVIGLVGGICSKGGDGKVMMRWKEYGLETSARNELLLH